MIVKWSFLHRLMLLTVIACVIGQTDVGTQRPSDDKKKKSEADKEKQDQKDLQIQNFLLNAKSQTVEVYSDVMFGGLGIKLVNDANKRRELIEEVFRRAPEAKEPYKLKQREGLTDTRSGYRSMAFDLNLDTLSIQLRAIQLMLAVDRPKARELFREIPEIKLPPLSCDDDLDYEVSEFYNVLKDIVEQTFDSEAKRRWEGIYFAKSYIDTINSPSQVRPALNLIISLKTTHAEFGILLESFTSVLRKISYDPRSFAFSFKYDDITTRIKFSLGKIREKGFEPTELLKAYRKYLSKHLTDSQCGDSLVTDANGKPISMLGFANTLFESPLIEDEIKPATIGSRAKPFAYWRSPKAAKLLNKIKTLRFGIKTTALTLEERSGQIWQQSLLEFLEQMDEWKPEDEETESDYLHQRCVLYDSLLQLTPPDATRTSVLQNYALFLRDTNMQKESPVQWLYYVKYLLTTGKTLKGKELDDFIAILKGSGNEVFTLYTEMDRLRTPDAGKP